MLAVMTTQAIKNLFIMWEGGMRSREESVRQSASQFEDDDNDNDDDGSHKTY